MKLHPCPTQNSVFQASHCSTLLIGCVKFCSRLYMLASWCNVNHSYVQSVERLLKRGIFSSIMFKKLAFTKLVWWPLNVSYVRKKATNTHMWILHFLLRISMILIFNFSINAPIAIGLSQKKQPFMHTVMKCITKLKKPKLARITKKLRNLIFQFYTKHHF